MKYKVCILAAGTGSRMGELSKHVNKAVLPVNFKAVISHIIEKFPNEIEIVIAVGHKKETVIDYVQLAHKDRSITFVEIEDHVGPGTGPGLSLLQCRNLLDCPFVFYTADTIVLEEVPVPDRNWYGIAPVNETEQYCSVRIKGGLICELDDKMKTDNEFAFVGLAGVYDFEEFFCALEKNKKPVIGEIQTSNGFKHLICKKLEPTIFTWFDTGTFANYTEANKSLSGGDVKFDFGKGDEFLYFVNGQVIKYFADKNIVFDRCRRAELLMGLCPEISGQKDNFYSYNKIDGHVLYDVLDDNVFNDFLLWADDHLWKKQAVEGLESSLFVSVCDKFYSGKTTERLDMFYLKTGVADTRSVINGVDIPPMSELLSIVDWDMLSSGTPSVIHGDLNFGNILVTDAGGFMLLDWRQNFGGMVTVGDLYYDLAKLYGGIIMSYQMIKENKFSFSMSGNNVFYSYDIKSNLLDAMGVYEAFIHKKGYDLRKIKILVSIIFLNMSPLHHDPFDHLLYFLGKSMLYKNLV